MPELLPKEEVEVTTGRCSPTLKRASVLSVVIMTGLRGVEHCYRWQQLWQSLY